MSWENDHIENILLNRMIFSDKNEVEQRLSELRESIYTNKSKLKMFASIVPDKIIPKDNRYAPVDWLNDEIENILLILQDEIIQKYELELYLKHLEENPDYNKIEESEDIKNENKE